MRRLAAAVVMLAVTSGCSGGTTSGSSSGSLTPVQVLEDVDYYYACGDEILVLPDGRRWYPLIEQDRVDPTRYGDAGNDVGMEARAVAVVLAMQVAVPAPGPGDDVGTLTVFSDGMGRFVSDNGRLAWLTLQPQTYNWVC